MGRGPDPEVVKQRRCAVELENQGLNAPEIARAMGVASVERVRKWLQRERGYKKPPYKVEIERRLNQGQPLKQIAAEVGCSEENVRFRERKRRDQLETKYVSERDPERWVDEFEADPEAMKHKRFTRYESFGNALIARLNHATNTNPKAAKELIDLAIGQFSLMRRIARKQKKIRRFTCGLVQATAADAARERALNRGESALTSLQVLGADYPGCESCEADLARREAMVFKDLRKFRQAFSRLKASQCLYRNMGHAGHDGHANGLGSCADTEVTLLYLVRDPRQAILVADYALEKHVTPADATLFTSLRFNKSLALLEFDDETSHKAARETAQALYDAVGPEPSVQRIRIVWLAGRAAEINGELDVAQSLYCDACEDAEQLQITELFAALLSDEKRLQANPTLLQARIERLRVHHDGKPQNRFPSWLKPIAPVLCQTFRLSDNNIGSALEILRRESGGNKHLPLNAAMARL